MVEEANRLQSKKVYKLEDCWDFDKSKEIFLIYQNQYSADYSLERIARNWNGGPSGYKKDSTLPYWNKVESKFKELKIKYYEERSFY